MIADEVRKRIDDLQPGKWELPTDSETAGVVDELIRANGWQDQLSVRVHPWLPVGQIVAMRPGASFL